MYKLVDALQWEASAAEGLIDLLITAMNPRADEGCCLTDERYNDLVRLRSKIEVAKLSRNVEEYWYRLQRDGRRIAPNADLEKQ